MGGGGGGGGEKKRERGKKKRERGLEYYINFTQVLSIMGEMDEAVRKLEKAKSLDSEERAIQVELEKALQKRKVSQDRERQMYRRMMEGGKPAKQPSKLDKASLDSSTWVSVPIVYTCMYYHQYAYLTLMLL